jgi:hypothetical protein
LLNPRQPQALGAPLYAALHAKRNLIIIMASSNAPKARKSFNWDNLLKSRPKQTPPPAPAAAPQQKAADPDVIVLDDADELHQREADSKMTAIMEYVNLMPRPPSPPPAGKGKRTFTEVEKGIALEEMRQMRTRAATVRELKRKNPVADEGVGVGPEHSVTQCHDHSATSPLTAALLAG